MGCGGSSETGGGKMNHNVDSSTLAYHHQEEQPKKEEDNDPSLPLCSEQERNNGEARLNDNRQKHAAGNRGHVPESCSEPRYTDHHFHRLRPELLDDGEGVLPNGVPSEGAEKDGEGNDTHLNGIYLTLKQTITIHQWLAEVLLERPRCVDRMLPALPDSAPKLEDTHDPEDDRDNESEPTSVDHYPKESSPAQSFRHSTGRTRHDEQSPMESYQSTACQISPHRSSPSQRSVVRHPSEHPTNVALFTGRSNTNVVVSARTLITHASGATGSSDGPIRPRLVYDSFLRAAMSERPSSWSGQRQITNHAQENVPHPINTENTKSKNSIDLDEEDAVEQQRSPMHAPRPSHQQPGTFAHRRTPV